MWGRTPAAATKGSGTRRVVVTAMPGDRARGIVRTAGIAAQAALGVGGIRRHKREGDGRTPAGRFRLVAVFYRADRTDRPRTGLPLSIIRHDTGWCDDPADRNYNRPIRLPYRSSHERLWREDGLYDIVVALDFNLRRPQPNAGSAIFLHIAAPGFAPTAGCIAVSEATLRRLLARASRRTVVEVR
jgi:L,D-peptidoglycan transpeptidase YkuD (ErfK/YbiS/YcfS/YnhG family)